MRQRDLNRLASTPYDVLVVGGGIHGLAIAYDAASRGLHVALIDAADFGSGSSFNHQKTVHGGLRALQSLSLRKARAAVKERRALARIAPWLLRPLPFIIGTYRSATRGRLALRAAFALDAWIGRKRNDGLEPELHLPKARLLSRTATLKLFPGVRQDRLTGGAQWYDYQMVENDRLTFAVATAADRAGADLANYVTARSALKTGNRIEGMRVQDKITGSEFDVRAKAVVNAAGAGTGDVLAMWGIVKPFPLVRAMNLVTARPASDIALAAPGPDGRMLTLVPWRGRAIVGTFQSAAAVQPDSAGTAGNDVESFIAQANHAFPALKLTPADVTLVHSGLVPAVERSSGAPDLLPASRILDHDADGVNGALSVAGAKYTTARATAEQIVNVLARKLGKRLRPCRTATTVLPGAGIADHEALAIETGRRVNLELPEPLLRHLVSRYAEGAATIVELIAERPETAATLASGVPTIATEVVHAIRHECAVRLSDIVLRRTTLGAAGHPGADTLREAASVAAAELGWDQNRVSEEIAEVARVYPRLT
jgi:glycerol-3-phosphate dehydrogenase